LTCWITVSFQLDAGERVGLIGRNGSGKSSLLRALAGQAALDDGTVWRQAGNGHRLRAAGAGFRQLGRDVFETIADGLGAAARLLVDYHEVPWLARSSEHAGDPEAMARLTRPAARSNRPTGGWRLNQRVEQVVARTRTRPGGEGFQRSPVVAIKRVALARALVAEPEMLLLDEPTNHLDIGRHRVAGRDADRLANVSMVFVTHDRRFLDRVATRIVELDRGKLLSCPGNFAAYQAKKEQMLHDEAIQNAKFDKFLAQEEVWIRKGVEARRTRNEGRVLRLEQLRRERVARRDRRARSSSRSMPATRAASWLPS
jgi:ATP-binding cassette subfamily F protein uup